MDGNTVLPTIPLTKELIYGFLGGPAGVSREERNQAIRELNDWRMETGANASRKVLGLSRQDIGNRLMELLDYPEKIQQGTYGYCVPACFIYWILVSYPEKIVRYIKCLFSTDNHIGYIHNLTVKINYELLDWKESGNAEFQYQDYSETCTKLKNDIAHARQANDTARVTTLSNTMRTLGCDEMGVAFPPAADFLLMIPLQTRAHPNYSGTLQNVGVSETSLLEWLDESGLFKSELLISKEDVEAQGIDVLDALFEPPGRSCRILSLDARLINPGYPGEAPHVVGILYATKDPGNQFTLCFVTWGKVMSLTVTQADFLNHFTAYIQADLVDTEPTRITPACGL